MDLIKVFLWGMIVSFLGTLPLGTLNVAAMQISVQENITNAIYFSLGSLSTEMVYVRISLVGINWIQGRELDHLRYIAREGVSPEGDRGHSYSKDADSAEPQAFA